MTDKQHEIDWQEARGVLSRLYDDYQGTGHSDRMIKSAGEDYGYKIIADQLSRHFNSAQTFGVMAVDFYLGLASDAEKKSVVVNEFENTLIKTMQLHDENQTKQIELEIACKTLGFVLK